jgi:hypothetical protein
MRLIRRSVLGAAVAISVSALSAPIAGAQVFPFPYWGYGGGTNAIGQASGPTGCQADSPVGVGFAGGTTANNCFAGWTAIGPAVGESVNVTGPVVTGSAILAPVVVAAGPTSAG